MESSSSIFVVWPNSLPVPLIGRTHKILPRSDAVQMESNRVRFRRTYHEAEEILDVTWNFTRDQYNEFRNFFIEELNQGVYRFQMMTAEMADPPALYHQVTRVLSFLTGNYSVSGSDNLITVSASLEVDSEEVVIINPPEPPVVDHPFDPPPVVTYPDPVCKDEIQVDLPTVAGLVNVEIQISDHRNGPWAFWGETLRPVTSLLLSNYFAGKWVKIRAQTEGTVFSDRFQFDPPAVLPPEIQVESGYYHYVDGFVTDYTPAELSPRELIYAGTSALDPDRVIAAVYLGNRIHPTTLRSNYEVELFNSALVEVGPRYEIPMPSDGSHGIARITFTSAQDDVTFKITTDATDPTISNGSDSPAVVHLNATRPYAIGRAFKDGCKSPPVYIPLDTRSGQALQPYVYSGTGTYVCECGVYQYVETIPGSGVCELHNVGTTGPACPGPPVSPCPQPSSMLNDAIVDACGHASGSTPFDMGEGQMRGVATITPISFLTGGEWPYFGPDPHTCPSAQWGGGWWKTELQIWYLSHFIYTWDNNSFQYRPAGISFCLGELYCNVGPVPTTIPGNELERIVVSDLTGPFGGSTNNAADKAFELAQGFAFCNGSAPSAALTGFDITVSCCNW